MNSNVSYAIFDSTKAENFLNQIRELHSKMQPTEVNRKSTQIHVAVCFFALVLP
jgi:hypothetical protein